VQPPPTLARRAAASTCTARSPLRSSTIPPSQVENPGSECPPPRTANGTPTSRATEIVAATSPTAPQRTTARGRLLIAPFHTRRPTS